MALDSDPRPLRVDALCLLGQMVHEMGMNLGNVSIASSGDTLPNFVLIEPFRGPGHHLLERGKEIFLERGKGI